MFGFAGVVMNCLFGLGLCVVFVFLEMQSDIVLVIPPRSDESIMNFGSVWPAKQLGQSSLGGT